MTDSTNPPARSVENVSRQLLDEMNELFALATNSIIHNEDGWHCRVCGMELDSERGHRDNCLARRVLDSAVTLHGLEESLKEESSPQHSPAALKIDPRIAALQDCEAALAVLLSAAVMAPLAVRANVLFQRGEELADKALAKTREILAAEDFEPVIDARTARDIVDVLIDELVERRTIPYSRWEVLTARDLDELTQLIVKRYSK